MPPTLIASIYGMNIILPTLGGIYDFLLLIVVMLISVLLASLLFRMKRKRGGGKY